MLKAQPMRLQGTFPNYRLMSCISSFAGPIWLWLWLPLADFNCGMPMEPRCLDGISYFWIWQSCCPWNVGCCLWNGPEVSFGPWLALKRGRWRHGFWDRFGSQFPVVFWAYKVGVHLYIVIHSWYIYIYYIHITIYNIHRDIVIIFTYYSMQLSQSQYPDT